MIETLEKPISKKVFEEQFVDIVKRKRVYYAHSMHLYNTPQEIRDIQLLESLGYKVVNPNTPEVQQEVEELKKDNPEYMDIFDKIIAKCDLLAYRCHANLKIPAGVWKEIGFAKNRDLPIIELPTLIDSRELSVNETRQYLHYNGQR